MVRQLIMHDVRVGELSGYRHLLTRVVKDLLKSGVRPSNFSVSVGWKMLRLEGRLRVYVQKFTEDHHASANASEIMVIYEILHLALRLPQPHDGFVILPDRW